VDDVLRGQSIPFRDFCIARLAAAEQPALVHELRSGRAMDRTIDAAATEQR
jgi:hypothetical protein